mgnify:CR=1 FL=1
MRRPFVAGNWKMNKTNREAISFVSELVDEVSVFKRCEIAVFPPFTALSDVVEITRGSNVEVGAQNVYSADSGAFTGEISPLMLKAIEVTHVIIGHSERRKYFKETDEFVNEKIHSVIGKGLKVIFCIGETLEERKANKTFDVVTRELTGGLNEITSSQLEDIVIAYEPIWAIGTGITAKPAQAEEVISFIRRKIGELYDNDVAQNVRILYGGSIKPDNFDAIITEEDIDGGLVGGASLKIDSFIKLVEIAERHS